MTKPFLFVGDDLRIHTGADAQALLKETHDGRYVEPRRGVVRVPKERWEMAQRYERRTWMEASAHAGDDRNYQHAAAFQDYSELKGRVFARAIELGCGPFTNLRVVARGCRIGQCTLLDPLLLEYLSHRNCTYRHGRLETGTTTLHQRLGDSLVGRVARRAIRALFPEALSEGVAIEQVLAVPIEEMPLSLPYDLVVMINVIEHCFDVEKVFGQVLACCRPGTVFVFHDRLYDAARVKATAGEHFDAGHPLRVDGSVIRKFLADSFVLLFEHETDIADEYQGLDLTERGLYFIGERK